MPRSRITGLGSKGLNTDRHPTELPPDTWTRMDNVTPKNGKLRSVPGDLKLFDLDLKPVYHRGFVDISDGGALKLIVSDGVSVYAYDMDGSYEDITPASGAWDGDKITFAPLNGVLVVNSASNGPFYWPGTGGVLTELPGWDPTWFCNAMAAYRYYLVALGMTEDGDYYPHKVRWSNSAEEGAIPTEWVASLANDAGDDLLGETPGEIVTGIPLRDSLAIIKTDDIYPMRWIGGQYVMQIERSKGGVGVPVHKLCAELRGTLALFTGADLLAYDGQGAQSIVTGRVQGAIRSLISQDAWRLSELFVHYPTTRVFLAGVNTTSNRHNGALVYDWTDDTWTQRRLQYGYGFDSVQLALSIGAPLWNDLVDGGGQRVEGGWLVNGTWNEQTSGTWGAGYYSPGYEDILLYESNAADDAWWVSLLDQGLADSQGNAKYCVAERQDIPLEGADGLAMVTEVWPECDGNTSFLLYIGAQEYDGQTPTWSGPFTVTPRQTASLDPRITGRYLCVRVESNTVGWWSLAGLTVNHERAGER